MDRSYQLQKTQTSIEDTTQERAKNDLTLLSPVEQSSPTHRKAMLALLQFACNPRQA